MVTSRGEVHEIDPSIEGCTKQTRLESVSISTGRKRDLSAVVSVRSARALETRASVVIGAFEVFGLLAASVTGIDSVRD